MISENMTVEEILRIMVEKDASDIYLTAGVPPAYRVEGKTIPIPVDKLDKKEVEKLAYSIMSEKQKASFREEKEMNLAIVLPNLGRFRVNVFYQRGSVGIVIRQIKFKIPTLDDLKLPAVIKDISMTLRGLVIVVGATGCGKSTTLAAMIDFRNSNSSGHIITVEDPIEFVHEHKRSIITQREVGIDTFSFDEALKNTLRQAPDVILIGEVRDVETMSAAITFAETGHLCLATIHANNANQAIERIINFFPAKRHDQIYLLLSLNLRSIISQRLIPTLDNKRVLAMEILMDTPRVKDLILHKEIALLKESMKEGGQEGMQTFDQSIFDLYVQGGLDYDTAIAYADSANDLRLKIKFENPELEKDEVDKPTFKIKQ